MLGVSPKEEILIHLFGFWEAIVALMKAFCEVLCFFYLRFYSLASVVL